jgi:hypothetical protein
VPQIEPIVLDLKTGSVFGAAIGMDEAAARDALAEHHVTDVRKYDQQQPKQFSLDTLLGVTLWFRGSRDLNDIYTNSPRVSLSNGLKVGQTIQDFTALLGPPTSTRKLPSGKHSETIYQVGPFDLGAISVDAEPDLVRAMRLVKRE